MLEYSIATLAGFTGLQQLYRSPTTVVARGVRSRDNLPVAIKYSANEYPSLREEAARRNELDILTELDSPHIIRAHGLERLDNRLLLIEDYAGGVTIGSYFRTHEVSIEAFLAIAATIAEALAAVHARNIIHKDISPNNILIDPRTRAVKLIDFGIASRLTRESHDLRHPDGIQGTLAYISPEQTGRMNRAVDLRSDLYSFGATLYHLLARIPPFGETSPLELVHAHIAKEPRPVSEINRQVPPMLARIVEKLMSKALETRYQSALGVHRDLERCARQLASPDAGELELAQHDVPTRFEIPQRIYGRERELEVLLGGFARVALGHTELLLVGGYSGTGKSSLVHEVHKPIVRRRGYFIAGKFDQFNRSVPYSALGQAFSQMVEIIFTEPADRVAAWKAQIQALAGPNGRMLVDVIPGLEQLIGPQPELAALAPSDAQRGFSLLFQRFVRLFARQDHPLVVFLDDLQWADNPSLQLLESLLGDIQVPYLYVITSYRDNEVGPGHPFLLSADNIKRAGTTVHELVLSALAPADAGALIASTLRRDPAEIQPLADVLYDKTGGNPFFLIQLLHSFHDTGLVRFDPASGGWTWNLERILEVGITSNVVEVMTARLQRLPASCTAALTAAACIGGSFDLKTLATVCEAPYHVIAHQLWPALSEGLIVCGSSDYQAVDERLVPDAGAHHAAIRHELHRQLRDEIDGGRFNVVYRFLHDRVQQAAYQLIPDRERQLYHLHVARLLLRRCTSDAQRDELIFELTHHYNLGLELVGDPAERLTLVALNLRAGLRAKAAAANRAAVRHFTVALGLLGPDAWTAHYELMFPLHKHLAECQYLVGELAESEQLSRKAIAHGRAKRDIAELYATRIQLLMTGAEVGHAMQAAAEALALFGFTLPDSEEAAVELCASAGAEVERKLATVEVGALFDLPARRDPEYALQLELMVHTWCAATFGHAALRGRLAVYWMVTTSLDHGNAAASALGYLLYGIGLATDGDYRRGFELGKVALRLSDDVFPDPVHALKVRHLFANSLNGYFNHLETNHPYYLSSYLTGPQVGDMIYSVWAAHLMVLLRTMTGAPLADVLAESDRYIEFVRDAKDHRMLNAYEIHRQMILCLQDKTCALGSLDSPTFDEAERAARHERSGFRTGMLWYGGWKVLVLCILGHYDRALAQATANEAITVYGTGMWSGNNHFFYPTIAMFQAYPLASPEQRAGYDKLIERNIAKHVGWAQTCPVNFQHRLELMLAERARIAGRSSAAVEYYDLSIEHASRGRFTQDEALALELAGRYYRGRGRSRVARVYLTDAYYAYARWGAAAKTRAMVDEYGDLLLIARDGKAGATVLATLNHTTREEGNRWLDLVTVLKATQAISSEIVQDKLLATVMSILTENAGAERGVMLLERHGELVIEVGATDDGPALVRRPLAEYPEIAVAVVNLVYRTKRSVVLDDARSDARFVGDAYVIRAQPRSVLCLPIMNQGRLRGVAYFENNLSCGVFTMDRLAVLEPLISQAAISIENAALYGELESRVQDRTEALHKSLDELKLAQVGLESANTALRKEMRERQQIEVELRLAQKLEAVGRLAAGIAHEINTPVQFIKDNVSFVREGTQDLIKIITMYGELQAVARAHGSAELAARLEAFESNTDLPFLADRMPEALDDALYGLGRAATLVRSMKEFAHGDQRDKAPSDVNRALTATLSIAHSEYKYVAELKTTFGDIPPLVCHINELNQCFLNLIVNAAHAITDVVHGTTETGVIEVTTRVHDGAVVVTISDTGAGIPLEIRDKIFDPFFTTKELGRGTGQGLAIARSVIVDKHGGTLTFQTELGRGTTFIVRLPLIADPMTVAA